MTKTRCEISAIGSDLLISHVDEYCYLAIEMQREMAWQETVMCKANADEVLKIAWALDSIRDDIQKWYDRWKGKDFEANQKT